LVGLSHHFGGRDKVLTWGQTTRCDLTPTQYRSFLGRPLRATHWHTMMEQ